jgi:hypothetical protein
MMRGEDDRGYVLRAAVFIAHQLVQFDDLAVVDINGDDKLIATEAIFTNQEEGDAEVAIWNEFIERVSHKSSLKGLRSKQVIRGENHQGASVA